jgi:hypothetical protein
MERIIFGEINHVHALTYDETLMEKQYSYKRLGLIIVNSSFNFATIVVFKMIVAFEEKELTCWNSNKGSNLVKELM